MIWLCSGGRPDHAGVEVDVDTPVCVGTSTLTTPGASGLPVMHVTR